MRGVIWPSQLLNTEEIMTGDMIGFIAAGGIVLAGILNFFVFSSTEEVTTKSEPKIEVDTSETPVATPQPATPQPDAPTISWAQRLTKGLSASREQVWGKLGNIFSGSALNDDQIEEVEELLYGADIGPNTVMEIMDELQAQAKKEGFGEEAFKEFLYNFLKNKMSGVQTTLDQDLFKHSPSESGEKKTKVIMIVGVNGAGKTTTIGKLATKLTNQGANVVVGACDTFRAAAVDQLQVWCDRAGATMIRAKEGANPSGVGYEALQKALSMKADYCLLDTAGRLHTKENLMDELAKSKNVLAKLDQSAPDHVLLVLDAITGQNALRQAEEFHKTLGLTGLIFTKCDGSSKAGSAVGIVEKLQVPITYIGVGESVEDLNEFRLEDYLGALLDYRVNA
ncbi:MAG: signal recognition particle-docking protein FtsY [Oligoflexia bacterium]|nr:signal recognition particle-docking protein FtsY [Oligoflexia bacterium]